ncbi:single-stranded DNA-binding protein [Pseudonocardia sp. N23]|uniref:single-stranded DNA-binding protein n=1 Tax=Pseudonocardia sp. N23 TaxID=1987376 RepID=UPI000BFCD744|nr:single-stranded DNA-binding protein [Pseudonocardia sp. N23]GAY07795.1 single-stranded DNA-binding protein [Pseudonocardia sp. N23]
MNEIYTTIVGNVASTPMRRRTADGTDLASFRLASNVRRFDRDAGEWVTSGTSYVTVTAWRRLGVNVGASFVKGDPVVVYGRLSTREYTTKEGDSRIDVEIDANAIGPDLSRCTAAVSRPRPQSGVPGSDAAQDLPAPRDGDASDEEVDGELDEELRIAIADDVEAHADGAPTEVSDDPWSLAAQPATVG